ncbi:hypothetical protein [Plantactinospora sp. BC1]|uniref:hypothetical protein n=1 Tax=Plantactinospora sp. BC1 TaxID=2108470 RepID=UPI001F477306|nr:hypothetical protein [Plantactinospora sp. BC1]
MPHTPPAVPDFTRWPSFPFEGEFRVKQLDEPVAVEPPRKGEGSGECHSCNAPDDAYIWVSERWRVRAMDRPTGLPMVLILESRSHLDLGDLPNLLAAELGVMTVRLERAVRSLDGVARVHVNRWGDGAAHLHLWFLARPYGRLQLRGTFLSLWDDILPPIPESQWRENLALVAAWLAEFGGRPLAEPPRIQWQAPSSLAQQGAAESAAAVSSTGAPTTPTEPTASSRTPAATTEPKPEPEQEREPQQEPERKPGGQESAGQEPGGEEPAAGRQGTEVADSTDASDSPARRESYGDPATRAY